jgi:predicted metal-dependent phosphoesterase TrpH
MPADPGPSPSCRTLPVTDPDPAGAGSSDADWLRCDLHLHTNDDRYDRVRHDVVALIDRAAVLGLDVIAVTNHLGISRREDAREHARARGILLLDGVELTVEGRHVLLIEPAADVDPGRIRRFPDLRAVRRPESLLVPAHPFFPGPTRFGRELLDHGELWDALEHAHFYVRGLDFNRPAERAARELGIPLLATSDAHDLRNMGSSHTLVRAPRDPAAVLSAIRRGFVRLATRPLGYVEAARVLWRTGRTAGRMPVHEGPGPALPQSP